MISEGHEQAMIVVLCILMLAAFCVGAFTTDKWHNTTTTEQLKKYVAENVSCFYSMNGTACEYKFITCVAR